MDFQGSQGDRVSTPTRPVAYLAVMTGGLSIWAAHFALTYASQTMFCASVQPADASLLWAIEGIVTVGAGAALLVFARWLWARPRVAADAPAADGQKAHFVRHVATAGIGLALLAIVWSTLPMLLLEPCGPPTL
jgi:hypothetical protein